MWIYNVLLILACSPDPQSAQCRTMREITGPCVVWVADLPERLGIPVRPGDPIFDSATPPACPLPLDEPVDETESE